MDTAHFHHRSPHEPAGFRSPTVRIPLSRRPILVASGIGVHGMKGSEQYQLPDLWCVHLYRYDATLVIDKKEELTIYPGCATVLAPNMHLDYRFKGRSTHLFVHFRFEDMPRSDEEEDSLAIPLIQDLSDDFGRMHGFMEPLVGHSLEPRARSDARLWDALWQLATHSAPGLPHDAVSSAVRSAVHSIELNLGDPIRVADVASHVGVSLGYLSQLFRKEYGVTVVDYIRKRRTERARHLLINSTLSIKSIAALVGMDDLQQFNKLIHRELGCSPRDMRSRLRNFNAEIE